jgi:hypothetical protein
MIFGKAVCKLQDNINVTYYNYLMTVQILVLKGKCLPFSILFDSCAYPSFIDLKYLLNVILITALC